MEIKHHVSLFLRSGGEVRILEKEDDDRTTILIQFFPEKEQPGSHEPIELRYAEADLLGKMLTRW